MTISMRQLNAWLDLLPRTRLGIASREWPAYRALGVAGFYLALIVTLAGGLVTGRSLTVLVCVASACAASFYAFVYLRRRIAGHESMALLEHVWTALGASAAVLFFVRVPILPYLDTAIPGLCVFLAAGRIGCLLVGCCHGNAASVGICYGAESVKEGFPTHLAGVRLFPVPALESAALISIGTFGFALLPWGRPGVLVCWFLIAYGIVRFGLEALRGDARPKLLGLTQARWMSALQVFAAIWWLDAGEHMFILAGLTIAFLTAVVVNHVSDPRRALLRPTHIDEVRKIALAVRPPENPTASRTSEGVSIAASAPGSNDFAHISLSLPAVQDLSLLCEVAARSFRELQAATAQYSSSHVLHFFVPLQRSELHVTGPALYGHLVRRLQAEPAVPRPPGASEYRIQVGPDLRNAPPWYFTRK